MQTKTPRSPYLKLGGLVFLGRTIDKIRLGEAGELRPDFIEMMGKGFDARMMAYLELDYAEFAAFVRTGATDEQCLEYIQEKGRKLNDVTTLIWNDFATKRGWNDSGSEILAKYKGDNGLSTREDIRTFFEFMEVDEGRRT